MRKIVIAIFLTAVITAGISAQNGIIREFTGDVELKHAGSAVFVPASAGASITTNTIISTGFRSTAVIEVGSSVISVSPLTRLTLAEIQSSENSENVNVDLAAGRVRVDVKPPAGTRANFTVQSPSATASVRGTSFEMDTQNLVVNEGRVILNGTAGLGVMVNKGNATYSGASGLPANPIEVAASALAPLSPIGVTVPDTVSQPSADPESGPATLNPVPVYPK